jgi:hypothetical protein
MKVKDIIKEMEAPIQGKFGPGTIAGKKAEIVQPNGITTTVDLTNPENAAKFRPNAAGQLQFDQDPNPGTMGAPAQAAGQAAPVAPIAPGAPVSVVSDEQAIGEEQNGDVGGDPTDQYIKQIEIPRDDDLDEDPELNRIKHLSGMSNEQMGTPENETHEQMIARMERANELIIADMLKKHQQRQQNQQPTSPVAPPDTKAPEPIATPDRKAPAPVVAPPDRKAPVAPPDRKAPSPRTLELLKKL